MKTKWLRIGSLVVLLGLIAAIPVSTQVVFGPTDVDADGANLPLLILVNRMELSPEQMVAIHGLLDGVLEQRRALEARRAEFEQEMIAFTGTADELDEILAAFRDETEERGEAARVYVQDVIDQIKGILTLKQGEILQELFPGLLADRTASASQSRGSEAILGQRAGRAGGFQAPFGRQDGNSEFGLRERWFDQMEERLVDHPEIAERLRQWFGGSMSGGARAGRMQCGSAGMPLGQRGPSGAGFGQRCDGLNVWVQVQRGGTNLRGLDWIEQLVDVLELKLEAIG
jgi:hypothetical protein